MTRVPTPGPHEAEATTVMRRAASTDDLTTQLPAVAPDATRLLPPVDAAAGGPDADADSPRPRRRRPSARRSAADAGQAAAGTGPPADRPGQRYRSVHAEMTRPSLLNTLRAVARTTGELLITFGLVVLLFAAYELYGHTAIVKDHQARLNNQLAQAWADPTVSPSVAPSTAVSALPVPPGFAIGRLYIPKLHLQWVVVEGVTLADLRYAPGHYPGTAMPGQIGNFAVAGHREPGMFWDLDQVQPGDWLVVETRTQWFVYQVYENHIVTPHSVEVVAPAPNQPGVAPTEAVMTLTTCNPKWDNYQRMAVHATLQATLPHDTRPPQLSES